MGGNKLEFSEDKFDGGSGNRRRAPTAGETANGHAREGTGSPTDGNSGAEQENGLLLGRPWCIADILPDSCTLHPPSRRTMGLLKTYEGIEQRLRKFRAEMLEAARVVHDLPRRRVRLVFLHCTALLAPLLFSSSAIWAVEQFCLPMLLVLSIAKI